MKRWLFGTALATALGAGSAIHAQTPATVTVTIPVGATLTIDGQRTEQMTGVRQFITPPLSAGTYTYLFKAIYSWNGSTVTRETPVKLSAGQNVNVDMLTAPEVATSPKSTDPNPLPGRFEPKPTSPKVDEPKKKVTDASSPPTELPRSTEPERKTEATPAAAVQDKKEDKKPEIEVPYVPTPEKVVAEMLKVASVKEGDVVYDLGCGDGRIVIAAVKNFKAKKGLGIDYNPERVKDSKDAARKAGSDIEKKLEFKQGDVLKMTEKDFEDVDVVTLYLLPEVNLRLKPILQKGLKNGARVVSHDFHMGDDWKPEKTLNVTDENGTEHTVYLWTIAKK